jgi:hypothetical protein
MHHLFPHTPPARSSARTKSMSDRLGRAPNWLQEENVSEANEVTGVMRREHERRAPLLCASPGGNRNSTSAVMDEAQGLPGAGEARRPGGEEGSSHRLRGTAGHPAPASRYRDSDDPRTALRQLAAYLDELLRVVGDVRASRLRQLGDSRSARGDRADLGSPERGRRAPAGPDL